MDAIRPADHADEAWHPQGVRLHAPPASRSRRISSLNSTRFHPIPPSHSTPFHPIPPIPPFVCRDSAPFRPSLPYVHPLLPAFCRHSAARLLFVACFRRDGVPRRWTTRSLTTSPRRYAGRRALACGRRRTARVLLGLPRAKSDSFALELAEMGNTPARAQTATVAVEEDDAAVAVSGGDDAGVDDGRPAGTRGAIGHAAACSRRAPVRLAPPLVRPPAPAVTASLQSSRVAEPARPKASGAAGGASTVPVCGVAAGSACARGKPTLTRPTRSLVWPRAPAQRAPGNIPFFEVSLTDWAKRGEGMNAYVVYTVVTKARLPRPPRCSGPAAPYVLTPVFAQPAWPPSRRRVDLVDGVQEPDVDGPAPLQPLCVALRAAHERVPRRHCAAHPGEAGHGCGGAANAQRFCPPRKRKR